MYSDRVRTRLGDIVDNADRVASYVGGASLAEFATNRMAVDAVERCIERIADAIVQLGEVESKRAALGVIWHEMRGLGNRLRHEYRRIDARVIYDTAVDDIPRLRTAAAAALTR